MKKKSFFSHRRNRPEARTVDDFMDGARRLLQETQTDRELVARFDQTWKAMAEACRNNDVRQIATLLKTDRKSVRQKFCR